MDAHCMVLMYLAVKKLVVINVDCIIRNSVKQNPWT